MKKHFAFGPSVCWLTLFAALASTLAAADAYHVIKRIPIPGDTGWDYITANTAGRSLYVPHSTEVVVLDLDSGAIVGKITGQKGVHGVPSRGNSVMASSAPPIPARSLCST
jgi:hypothetical protein